VDLRVWATGESAWSASPVEKLLQTKSGDEYSNIVLTLRDPGSLTGRIVDRLGNPLRAERVEVCQAHPERGYDYVSKSMPASADASFEFADCPIGRWRVRAFVEGIWWVSAVEWNIQAGERVDMRDVVLHPQTSLVLQLTTASESAPWAASGLSGIRTLLKNGVAGW
jgi:hypothetical protein